MESNINLNGHVEPQINETSFNQLKEDMNLTNDVFAKAIIEHQAEEKKKSKKDAFQKRFGKKTKSGYKKTKAKKRHANEAGISENVFNGEGMVDVLISFGPDFDPINSAHAPASLTARNVAGREMLNEVRDNKQQKTDDGNARRIIFDILNKKFSRVFNQLVAVGAKQSTINNAKSILDEMRAKRRGKPKPGAKTRSISQKSFNKMVDHVSDFLVLLANCPEYDSNVAELKLIALQDYRDSLTQGNVTASKSKAKLGTNLKQRNKFFNAKNTGYVDTFQATKRSVKAIFGADSDQYHLVAQFKFNRIY